MPPPVEDLLDEDDPFRLVIRAHAAVEQYVKMAIQSRFIDQQVPDELKHLGFTRTLALAISLGLVPPEVKGLSRQFTKLRDDFVHGIISELTSERAKRVFAPCRPYLDDDLDRRLEDSPPMVYLQLAAATVYLQVAEGVQLAEANRRFAEEALDDARARAFERGRLSLDQISKLLAETEQSE
jgi:hypothetical protein